MYERVTISDGEGKPILSYTADMDGGRVTGALFLPREVQAAIKTYLGVPQESPVGWSHSHNCAVTTEPTPHVFQCRMPFTMMVGVRLGPRHTSFVSEDGMKEHNLRFFRETSYWD